jgi:hypothetical protein
MAMKPATLIGFAIATLGIMALGGALAISGERDRREAASKVRLALAPPAKTPASAKPAAPAPDERFVIKRILPIEGPIRYGDWHWDEAGVPAGPLVITVDLEARVLSVFRGGY